MSLEYTCTQMHNAVVNELSLSSPASSMVSVQAEAAAVQVDGAAVVVDCVMTAEQIAARDAARLSSAADDHNIEKGQIQVTFKKVLAFVRNIDKSCRTPVTQEDVFKRQRWDIQALEKDPQRRKLLAVAAAADSDEDEGEEEEEDDDDNSSSSDEEEDQGFAHDGQLTDPAHIAQLIMGIEYCQNSMVSQKFATERALEAEAQVKAQAKVCEALKAQLLEQTATLSRVTAFSLQSTATATTNKMRLVDMEGVRVNALRAKKEKQVATEGVYFNREDRQFAAEANGPDSGAAVCATFCSLLRDRKAWENSIGIQFEHFKTNHSLDRLAGSSRSHSAQRGCEAGGESEADCRSVKEAD
jgi:hypothetical protein